MTETLKVSLPENIRAELEKLTQEEGLSAGEILREALREYLFIRRFRSLRARMMAKAQAQGIYTDEDVFGRVS